MYSTLCQNACSNPGLRTTDFVRATRLNLHTALGGCWMVVAGYAFKAHYFCGFPHIKNIRGCTINKQDVKFKERINMQRAQRPARARTPSSSTCHQHVETHLTLPHSRIATCNVCHTPSASVWEAKGARCWCRLLCALRSL